MKKYLFLVCWIFLILGACIDKEESTYHWVHYKSRFTNNPAIYKIYQLKETQTKDSISFSCLSERDTINFSYSKSNPKNAVIKGRYLGNGISRLLQDTTILLNNVSYRVTKHIVKENDGDDSGVIIYFASNIGVFVIHSRHWPIFSYLQSTDPDFNQTVIMLLKATVPAYKIPTALKD